MRHAHVARLTAILVVLVAADTGRAGVYNTMERPFDLGANFQQFQKNTLIPLRQLGNPDVGTPLNIRCLLAPDILSMAGRADWSSEARLNLSAYLIRIGHLKAEYYITAEGLLRNVVNVERDNFLAYANLGTATLLNGQLRPALEHMTVALESWPKSWNDLSQEKQKWLRKRGWDQTSYAWNRSVEEYQKKLVKLRWMESLRAPIAPGELPPAPDALFGDPKTGPVRFVADEKGNFVPGKIAKSEMKKLPPEAIPIVKQLLIWMPLDDRLYWLLGELYNAKGDIGSAKQIFQELRKKWESLGVKKGEIGRPPKLPTLFQQHDEALDNAVVRPSDSSDKKPGKNGPQAPFDWNSMVIGIGIGVMIAFFAVWQIRVLGTKRRKAVRTAK